jgi:hypothetical protein
MEIIERVIIGSSPLAIIEAMYLKSKGRSVVNIDERSEIGGAWTTISHFGFPEVELGCHIWSYNKETYQLISKLFNLELTKLSPQPTILFRKQMIPYDWKSNVISIQKVLKNITNLKQTIASPELRFSLFPSSYLYPSKGTLELKNSLNKLVVKQNLNIQLNIAIDKVVLKKGCVELFNKMGDLILITKELVLTSLSKISLIVLEDGSEVKLNTRKVDYIHVHLILENVSGRPFSYIRTNGDEVIHRLSDMTFQVKDQLEENQKLFCAGVFPKPFQEKSSEELKAYISIFLIKNKFISNQTHIANFASNVYPSYYNDSSFIDKIKSKTNGKVRFLRSTDFVYSFYNQKERYKELLLSNTK